jgi:hypothetical protein
MASAPVWKVRYKSSTPLLSEACRKMPPSEKGKKGKRQIKRKK